VTSFPLLAAWTTDDRVVTALTKSFGLIIPEMVLGVAACVLFLGGTFKADRHLWAWVALVSLAGAAVALAATWPTAPTQEPSRTAVFAGPLLLDPLALLTKVMALAAGVVLVLLGWNEVPDRQAAEYHGCLMVIVAGLCLTGSANELVTLFLALELISIPTYVLLYLPRHDSASQEAALKYFLLSVFSSALLLFGFSYLYGLAGTTNLPAVLQAFVQAVRDTSAEQSAAALPILAQVALVLVVAGLGFRITAVPFHFYAPDVYQGAPTSGAALLAFVPKAAGFVALLRVLGFVMPAAVLEPDVAQGQLWLGRAVSAQAPILLWILAAVSMFMGNLLALLQNNLKRLLAYSSVAHAGYMLIGLAVAPYLISDAYFAPAREPSAALTGGVETTLFYLAAYGAMTVGAFAVLAYLSTPQRPVETMDDLAGLGRSHPGVALLMLLFLFSLIGIPLTAGFAGKFMLFFGAMGVRSAEHAGLFRVLALLGVINSAIGAWYYLRIAAVMYLRTTVHPIEKRRAWPGLAALWGCAVLTVGLGFNPGSGWLLQAAHAAAGGAKAPAAAVAHR
jgi:NADH-quinone oxidoreductase subunit N